MRDSAMHSLRMMIGRRRHLWVLVRAVAVGVGVGVTVVAATLWDSSSFVSWNFKSSRFCRHLASSSNTARRG
jgi:hypothetical protein